MIEDYCNETELYDIEGLCPFANKCNIDFFGNLDCIYLYEDCIYYKLFKIDEDKKLQK